MKISSYLCYLYVETVVRRFGFHKMDKISRSYQEDVDIVDTFSEGIVEVCL